MNTSGHFQHTVRHRKQSAFSMGIIIFWLAKIHDWRVINRVKYESSHKIPFTLKKFDNMCGSLDLSILSDSRWCNWSYLTAVTMLYTFKVQRMLAWSSVKHYLYQKVICVISPECAPRKQSVTHLTRALYLPGYDSEATGRERVLSRGLWGLHVFRSGNFQDYPCISKARTTLPRPY